MTAQPPPQTSVIYRIGGTNYPMRVIGSCRTCRSIHRAEIENLVIMGYAWGSIADHLPPDSGLSKENIRHHFDQGHMPLPEALRRSVIERRAKMLRLSTADNAAPVVDQWVVTQAIMQRGFENIMTGHAEPDVKDTLAAAKQLSDIEARTSDERAINDDAVMAIIEGARSYMSQEDWIKFNWELKENPAMAVYGTVTDAEEVEELQERYSHTALPPVDAKADYYKTHMVSSQDEIPPPFVKADYYQTHMASSQDEIPPPLDHAEGS
jgi:hypothetical protein